MDADSAIPELPKNLTMGGTEEIKELQWQKGPVVMQSQNQISVGTNKPETTPEKRSSVVEEEAEEPSGMFMSEEEIAWWFHYPIDNISLQNDLYGNDLLYSTPSSSAPTTAAAASLPPPPPPSVIIPPATDDRRRKGIDTDDNECHSEDAKKQSRGGSTSTKRCRAAEVHNLSERRRRDRINEKMKALQELIPRCNKSDKATMLDEAIKYVKSLQMQIQMMSMGCNMAPMMVPCVQQYMPPMAMGMGMDMGMNPNPNPNPPMVPYSDILPDSSIPNPAHLGQPFPVPVPAYNMPLVTPVDPIASQPANMPDPMMNPLTLDSQNQLWVPNFADPFQQYIALYSTELPLTQNQEGMPSIGTELDSGIDVINPDHHPTG